MRVNFCIMTFKSSFHGLSLFYFCGRKVVVGMPLSVVTGGVVVVVFTSVVTGGVVVVQWCLHQ